MADGPAAGGAILGNAGPCAKRAAALAWEAANPRPGIYGGTGMGAQMAARQAAFTAGSAVQKQQVFSHSLLDLVKAFEKVQHWTVVRAAAKHGYNLWLMRLSLQAYRIRHTVSMEGFRRKVCNS